ncbi:hypothetical protein E2C01_028840 [Portunus trituberculatus]|uniref:Uncharacterized protein n=1 Tax=Portunus trituberculatus TaxID=210409 RepID=A0A5B7EQ53_PORTR|nr:hypothetical protein [Portunus trituberculatus]
MRPEEVAYRPDWVAACWVDAGARCKQKAEKRHPFRSENVLSHPKVVMAGAARRVSGTGLVAGARGRAANHSGSSSNRRRCGVGVGLTVLWVGLMVGLAQGYPQNGVMGVGLPKVIKCPSSMEISPCTCREMKKGKDSG